MKIDVVLSQLKEFESNSDAIAESIRQTLFSIQNRLDLLEERVTDLEFALDSADAEEE